jgi:rhodanese-related sulfurtransferase
MKNALFLVLFAGVVLLSEQSHGQSMAYRALLKAFYDADFPLVYPSDQEMLNQAVLLDTREMEEYRVSHLPSAKWVGYDTFELSVVDSISKDTPVVVYCSIGARSQDIGKRLMEAGFEKVYNLYGGIFHWVNEEYPVYNDQGATRKVHAYSRAWGVWVKNAEKVY